MLEVAQLSKAWSHTSSFCSHSSPSSWTRRYSPRSVKAHSWTLTAPSACKSLFFNFFSMVLLPNRKNRLMSPSEAGSASILWEASVYFSNQFGSLQVGICPSDFFLDSIQCNCNRLIIFYYPFSLLKHQPRGRGRGALSVLFTACFRAGHTKYAKQICINKHTSEQQSKQNRRPTKTQRRKAPSFP